MSEETPPVSTMASGASLDAANPAARRKPSTGSGSEALNRPARAGAGVEQPVVQPVGAPLPELHRLRQQPVAAPVRRARRVLAVLVLHALEGALQRCTVGHALALCRGPGGEPGAERPRVEIGVGVRCRDFLRAALDAHLALELRPQEHQARARLRGELAALAARVVGVEDKAAALDT